MKQHVIFMSVRFVNMEESNVEPSRTSSMMNSNAPVQYRGSRSSPTCVQSRSHAHIAAV